MGCFDTVTFMCPECGGEVKFQSKGGECLLEDYDGSKKIPLDVASGLNHHLPMTCSCGKTFIVKVKSKVRVRLVPWLSTLR